LAPAFLARAHTYQNVVMTVPPAARPGHTLRRAVFQVALASHAGALLATRDDITVFMFASHHKTGTNLGLELESCFAGDPEITRDLSLQAKRCLEHRTLDDLNWDGIIPPGCDRVVHFVRTPREVVRSAYLYHRQQPPVEPWLAFPAEQILGEAVPNNPFLSGETYNQYLVRVPIPVGVYAEMKLQFGDNFGKMEASYNATKDDPHVRTVCLEDAWMDYGVMIRRIASHLKLPYSTEVQSCTEQHDPSKHTFGTHTTHGTLSQTEMAQLRSTIARHDKDWFDGRFGKSPVASMCGSKVNERHNQRDQWLDGLG